MSDVNKLLRDEAEHAEQNKDAAPTSDTTVTRPGRERAKVLSVRLNAEEYEQLTVQAEVAGVGPSTLVRSMILQALNPGEGVRPTEEWMASVSERLERLEAKTETSRRVRRP
jgi:hypothetical protein